MRKKGYSLPIGDDQSDNNTAVSIIQSQTNASASSLTPPQTTNGSPTPTRLPTPSAPRALGSTTSPPAIVLEIENWLASATSSKVKLDVGGRHFSTSVGTLQCSRSENSKLAQVVAARQLDEDGLIFIDRDGDRFAHILNWLRDGKIPALSDNERRGLRDEAVYFGLTQLINTIDKGNLGEGNWLTPISQEQFTHIVQLHEERDSSGRRSFPKLDLSYFDLSGLCLRSLDLKNVNFRGASLRGTDLSLSVLSGAVFTNADCSFANLNSCELVGAQLSSATLSGASFVNANLTRSVIRSTDLSNAVLTGADLTEALLVHANLTSANLSSAKLGGCQLSNANLTGVNLTGSILSSQVSASNLTNSTLASAVFTNSNLSGALFKETLGVMDCEFRGATLTSSTSFVNTKAPAQWGNVQIDAKTLQQMGAKVI